MSTCSSSANAAAHHLLDVDGAYPRDLCRVAQTAHALGASRRPRSASIENGRVEQQAQTFSRHDSASARRCACTQPAGSASHSCSRPARAPRPASMSSQRRSSSSARRTVSAMNVLRRRLPTRRSSCCHEILIEAYVQTHGHTLAHRAPFIRYGSPPVGTVALASPPAAPRPRRSACARRRAARAPRGRRSRRAARRATQAEPSGRPTQARRCRQPQPASPRARRAACRSSRPSARASARSASRQAKVARVGDRATAASRMRASSARPSSASVPWPGAGTKRAGSSTRADLGLAAQALQAGAGEHDRVEAARRRARRACAGGVSTLPRSAHHLEVRRAPRAAGRRGAGCSSRRARRALQPVRVAPAPQRTSSAAARARRAQQREPVGQLARDVLGGVHREVDLAGGSASSTRATQRDLSPPRPRRSRSPLGRRSGTSSHAGAVRRRAASSSATSRACASASALPPGAEPHQRLRRRPLEVVRPRRAPGRRLGALAGACPRAGASSRSPNSSRTSWRLAWPRVLAEAAQADRGLVQQAAQHRPRDRLDAREVARRRRTPSARRSRRAPARRSRCRARAAR